MLALFVAYSGGFGFLIQTCDHCNKVKIYLFQQPECCPHSKTMEHQQGACADGECGGDNEEDAPCCHKERLYGCKIPETSPKIQTTQAKQCCMFEYMYFKINSSYLSFSYDKIIQPDADNNTISFDLLWEEGKLLLCERFEDKILPEKIPPLIPGGKLFVIYSHQLLFYA
jgi:hypothetical protein